MNKWAIVYLIFVMGFSQAFYLVFDFGRDTNTNIDDSYILFTSPLQSIYNTAMMSLRDILGPYNNLLLAKNSGIGKVL